MRVGKVSHKTKIVIVCKFCICLKINFLIKTITEKICYINEEYFNLKRECYANR